MVGFRVQPLFPEHLAHLWESSDVRRALRESKPVGAAAPPGVACGTSPEASHPDTTLGWHTFEPSCARDAPSEEPDR